MISRTYVVDMPAGEDAAVPVNILVQNNPGTIDAPVAQGSASYFEWRGRPLRFESVYGDPGFVPRLTLGFGLSVVPLVSLTTPIAAVVPSVALSQSLIPDLSIFQVEPLADPSGMPVIQLTGSSATASHAYLVTLQVMEAKDEDRTAEGT
jgi:hypothetical protein